MARAFQPAPFCTIVTPRRFAAFTFFRIMKNAIIGTALCFFALSLFAQAAIPLPEASPAATVGQTIGITDVNITYHRPAVNKRKIWGGLVPYDAEGTDAGFDGVDVREVGADDVDRREPPLPDPRGDLDGGQPDDADGRGGRGHSSASVHAKDRSDGR